MTLSCVMRFGGRRYRKCVVNAAAISDPCDAAANPSALIIDYVSAPGSGSGAGLVEEIVEYDGGAGDVLYIYVHGAGIDERVMFCAVSCAGAGRQYYHTDHQGSVIAMTDTSGAVAAVYTYTAWGEVNDVTGNPFRYTGRRLDAETGLYYYRARYYAPTLGRFLQVDPIGHSDNMNLYAYVGNDPVNATDPSGKIGFVGALVGGVLDAVLETAVQAQAGKGFDPGKIVGAGLKGAALGFVGAGIVSKVGKVAQLVNAAAKAGRTVGVGAVSKGTAAAVTAVAGDAVFSEATGGDAAVEKVESAGGAFMGEMVGVALEGAEKMPGKIGKAAKVLNNMKSTTGQAVSGFAQSQAAAGVVSGLVDSVDSFVEVEDR